MFSNIEDMLLKCGEFDSDFVLRSAPSRRRVLLIEGSTIFICCSFERIAGYTGEKIN